MSSKPLALVTGASGQTGSTGYYASKELVARGYRVRALVRTIDHRLSRLEALGDVEIFKGDLLDYESVRQAVKGVKRIYFVYPVSDGLLKATTYMAKAAREEGVKGLVNMSQATSLDQGVRFSNASQAHWCSEEIFNWANIGAIHINPYYFMENYIIFPGPTLQRESTVYVPYDPKMKHYPVASEDLGLVIAKLMVSPEAYNGQRIPLLGPNRGSWKEHYEVASKVLGKQINYVHVPVEAWAKASEAFIPDFTIKHLSGMARCYNEGGMDWDHSVSRLDEFIPRAQQTTVEQFFENNKELFGKQGLKLIYGVDE